jgi:CheY-like chemotaxis protein
MKKFHATILLVEDDKNDQILIVRAFRKVGVADPIHVVEGGEEAIAYMKGEGQYADRTRFAYPTFIITDLKMPRGDGFDVLHHLKSNPNWAVIPTVVFSASPDLDDIKKSYMLGASSYHVKPHSAEALREQLSVINAYWMTCQVPEVDTTGKQVRTDSEGKLGERFPQAGDEPTDPNDALSARENSMADTPERTAK